MYAKTTSKIRFYVSMNVRPNDVDYRSRNIDSLINIAV